MILKALLLSITVASISFLLSHALILERQRSWIRKKSVLLGSLIDCSYCIGHWIAAVLLVIMPVKLFDTWHPLDYLLTWLVISWLAGVMSMLTSWVWGDAE